MTSAIIGQSRWEAPLRLRLGGTPARCPVIWVNRPAPTRPHAHPLTTSSHTNVRQIAAAFGRSVRCQLGLGNTYTYTFLAQAKSHTYTFLAWETQDFPKQLGKSPVAVWAGVQLLPRVYHVCRVCRVCIPGVFRRISWVSCIQYTWGLEQYWNIHGVTNICTSHIPIYPVYIIHCVYPVYIAYTGTVPIPYVYPVYTVYFFDSEMSFATEFTFTKKRAEGSFHPEFQMIPGDSSWFQMNSRWSQMVSGNDEWGWSGWFQKMPENRKSTPTKKFKKSSSHNI